MIRGRLTNDHPAVKFGRPIFVDNDDRAYKWGEIVYDNAGFMIDDKMIIDREAKTVSFNYKEDNWSVDR